MNLTVGQLKKELSEVDRNYQVIFGSSYYRKRPLIFYRFKMRGEKKLQIELNEIDQGWEPQSEQDSRETVGYFLDHLEGYEDDCEITFGASLDTSPLLFESFTKAFSINLSQPEEPKWEVDGDKGELGDFFFPFNRFEQKGIFCFLCDLKIRRYRCIQVP